MINTRIEYTPRTENIHIELLSMTQPVEINVHNSMLHVAKKKLEYPLLPAVNE